MWERIMDSGALIVGAVILFVVFTAILFVIEKKDEKKADARKAQKPFYIVRKSDKAA
ncbi:MAG: hypothetical protein PHO15_10565 [Eubacteriales bacterium]|nr:hypothetical protein [Eubacteriales bacterium]